MIRSRKLASFALWAFAALCAVLSFGVRVRAVDAARVLDGVSARAARASASAGVAADRDKRAGKGDACDDADDGGEGLLGAGAAPAVGARPDAGSYTVSTPTARWFDGRTAAVARARGPPSEG